MRSSGVTVASVRVWGQTVLRGGKGHCPVPGSTPTHVVGSEQPRRCPGLRVGAGPGHTGVSGRAAGPTRCWACPSWGTRLRVLRPGLPSAGDAGRGRLPQQP